MNFGEEATREGVLSEAPIDAGEDDWASFGLKGKKSKKGKKCKKSRGIEALPPAVLPSGHHIRARDSTLEC